jgi:tRNA dimethylallyltransferase
MIDIIITCPLIAVVGFTASGKSDLAMNLAHQFNGEIIAADAVTVYKNFDIGSAKPTQKEQSEIQHHMLDIVEASTPFSAAMFKNHVDKIIEDIASRGKVPILVGGSGLYIDSILFDYKFRNDTNRNLREALNGKALQELKDIAEEKKLSTENVDIHNKRRLIRLIETDGQIVHKKSLRPNTMVLGIDISREELRERVKARVKIMIQGGLEVEARHLSEKYDWDTEPMRSIGYREWRPYFAGEVTIDRVVDDIETHTMQLAKKQKTWFKRNEHIHWVNNNNEAVAYVTTFVNT